MATKRKRSPDRVMRSIRNAIIDLNTDLKKRFPEVRLSRIEGLVLSAMINAQQSRRPRTPSEIAEASEPGCVRFGVSYMSADQIAAAIGTSFRHVRWCQERLHGRGHIAAKTVPAGTVLPFGATPRPMKVWRATYLPDPSKVDDFFRWEESPPCQDPGREGTRVGGRDTEEKSPAKSHPIAGARDRAGAIRGGNRRRNHTLNRIPSQKTDLPKDTTTTQRPDEKRARDAPEQGLAAVGRETRGAIAAGTSSTSSASGRAPNGATPSSSSTSSSSAAARPSSAASSASDSRPPARSHVDGEGDGRQGGGQAERPRRLDGDALTVLAYRRTVLRKLGLRVEDDPPHYHVEYVKAALQRFSVAELMQTVDLVARSEDHTRIRIRFTVRYLFLDPGPGVILDAPPPRAAPRRPQDASGGRGSTPGPSGRTSPPQNGSPGQPDFVNHSSYVASEQVSRDDVEGGTRALDAELAKASRQSWPDPPPPKGRKS